MSVARPGRAKGVQGLYGCILNSNAYRGLGGGGCRRTAAFRRPCHWVVVCASLAIAACMCSSSVGCWWSCVFRRCSIVRFVQVWCCTSSLMASCSWLRVHVSNQWRLSIVHVSVKKTRWKRFVWWLYVRSVAHCRVVVVILGMIRHPAGASYRVE